MTAKRPRRSRNTGKLSTLDDFLAGEGKREEFEAVAIKEVLAWQIAEAMKASKLSQNGLAQRMRTSRSQVRRLLDPTDGNVTLNTLQRAARIVGRSLRFELVRRQMTRRISKRAGGSAKRSRRAQ
jgi:antitoxin HicB